MGIPSRRKVSGSREQIGLIHYLLDGLKKAGGGGCHRSGGDQIPDLVSTFSGRPTDHYRRREVSEVIRFGQMTFVRLVTLETIG
jgi:hypothetical protein